MREIFQKNVVQILRKFYGKSNYTSRTEYEHV